MMGWNGKRRPHGRRRASGGGVSFSGGWVDVPRAGAFSGGPCRGSS
ncbi:hypothetical protein HMPREF9136_2146 [Prevotella dentalis DSM 3688]|uniref:Uncharacterized protein n=1 Tax=Prevotella dentalis (strain ATCC 49559 / DSM 3688 / JCM 13448 / NCTC 12043 / ES 2772) TaxID=908937 RepID=F9D5L8_PREDD|nr:hypothetical protein HMPREF9136_2146 [Prevotella dentalis DSM 3688]